jgi:electron transfer flavoprotein alpha subunit
LTRDIFVIVEHLRGEVSEITYVMLAGARRLAQGTGGSVVALLLGHNAGELAKDLSADSVWYVDHPALADFTSHAFQVTLSGLISDSQPRTVLLGDTSIGGDLAGWLSTRLSLPLVSACRTVQSEDDGSLGYTSVICGGKIVVSGKLPAATTLILMAPGGHRAEDGRSAQPPPTRTLPSPDLSGLRVSVVGYVEPAAGDVDVSKERILVAVGRGMQNADNLELAQELASVLEAQVCASRPVVDQGWLPTTRLVGKSGKRVKPALYLALGISGAPEHVEAIRDSAAIIAVNTDPAAPIFDVAQYGVQMDVLDLLPVLTERLRREKGG